MKLAIQEPTLVLDKCWQPTNAVTVRKAINTVASERARFLDHSTSSLYNMREWTRLPVADESKYVTGCGSVLRLPTIIVLKSFNDASLMKKKKNGKPIRSVVFSRKNLFQRDDYRCQYCGCKPIPSELSIDHVVPKSLWKPKFGELSSFENCVLACTVCNRRKANKPLTLCGLTLIRQPRTPPWSPLFAIARIEKFPEDWKQYLQMKNSELYWNVELED